MRSSNEEAEPFPKRPERQLLYDDAADRSEETEEHRASASRGSRRTEVVSMS